MKETEKRKEREKKGGEDVDRSLPCDVLMEILSRLPIKPLLRFKIVSKQWLSMIHDPAFINLHFDRSNKEEDDDHACIYLEDQYKGNLYVLSLDGEGKGEEEDDPTTYVVKHDFSPNTSIIIKSYCKGLICYENPRPLSVWVCNLSTKQQIKLPPAPCFVGFYWFGFNPSTNEYTIVLYSTQSGCYLFTLGTSSWRKIDSKPSKGCVSYDGETLSINGVLHRNSATSYNPSTCENLITWFDLKTEKFGYLSYPPNVDKSAKIRLYEFQETLCLFYTCQDVFNLWVLKDYNNNDDSWGYHRFINVPYLFTSQPRYDQILITRNWDILTVSSNGGHYLHSYNLRTSVRKKIKLIGLPSNTNICVMGGDYKENIFTLKTTGYIMGPRIGLSTTDATEK